MIRKTLFSLLALLLLLAAAMVVRASTLQSRQPAGEGSVHVALDSAGAVERFAGAIRIPTISLEDTQAIDSAAFRALHAYLADNFPLVHANLTRETVSDLSLLYTWPGRDPSLEPVVLMGHQDVVPVIPGTEDGWTYPPFGGVVADGYVWGRGTMDDKVSVLAILEAVETLLREGYTPARTVYLAFGHDEEVGGVQGARAIAQLLADRGAEPYALVMDEGGAVARGMIPGIEGAVALVGIAEKGYANVELLVEGAGGHSSTPPPQTNIGILAEAVSELEEHPFPARLEGPARAMFEYLAPEMSFLPRFVVGNLWILEPVVRRAMLGNRMMASMLRTTTAPTIIEGGVKANVLPIRARAVINHRIIPGETAESVVARDRRVIGDERVRASILGEDHTDPSPVSDPEGAAFQLVARTIKRVLPEEEVVVAPYLVMGGTDAKYYAGRSANVFRFLAAPVEADALERVHGTDERMGISGFLSSVAFFHELIRGADTL